MNRTTTYKISTRKAFMTIFSRLAALMPEPEEIPIWYFEIPIPFEVLDAAIEFHSNKGTNVLKRQSLSSGSARYLIGKLEGFYIRKMSNRTTIFKVGSFPFKFGDADFDEQLTARINMYGVLTDLKNDPIVENMPLNEYSIEFDYDDLYKEPSTIHPPELPEKPDEKKASRDDWFRYKYECDRSGIKFTYGQLANKLYVSEGYARQLGAKWIKENIEEEDDENI